MADNAKAEKPRADFPLYAHHNGQWAKWIKDKDRYFGRWSDARGLVDRWPRPLSVYMSGY